jgi:dipeptidase E
MKKIVAIGGGGKERTVFSLKTPGIDEEIIRLSEKKSPKLLFIPTASNDSQVYSEDAQNYFGGKLGCKTDVLYLINKKITLRELRAKIFGADIIYVGGGSSLRMMNVWRRTGADKILKQAYGKGIVLAGVSAGAICWFESGHSDSMKYYNPKNWKYINVRGIGLVKGFCCPHYNGESLGVSREIHFNKIVGKTGKIGIALDNYCAVEIADGMFFKIISSRPGAGAYRVYKYCGQVISEKIETKNGLMPLAELYKKKKSCHG